MKLKNKIILSLSVGLVSIIPVIILTSCSSKNNEYIPDTTPSTLDANLVKNENVFSIGTFNSRIVNEEKRQLQTEYYDSEIYKKYHENYNFRYPGQDFNYEQNNQNIFTNNSNPNDTINGCEVVYNERVTNENGEYINANGEVVTEEDQKIKYNNPDWICNEIKKGTFKKHLAADKFFLNDVSKIKSVTKEFEVSTAVRGDLTLGLFVPAGEEIEITFDDETWDLIKNRKNCVDFVINQNMWDNKVSTDTGRISNRYPFIETHFGQNTITGQTFKIGSPFGGGLSIDIRDSITKPDEIPLYSQIQNLKFTVKGAIPCIYYQDGITTEKEWFDQLQKASNNEIAPVLQAWSPYFSLSIGFNGLNTIGGRNIKDLIYPVNSFKKWNDFLYLSNYLAGVDLSNSVKRLNMEFCDDIWGGAGAWGGGMSFYCPTNWGVNSIFYSEPEEVFNAGNSWGVFHEINHNFQQDNALFSKRTHGETNQVTAFNLSIISDITRFRNEVNFSGENVNKNYDIGWPYLDTPYSIMKQLRYKGSCDEYPIYSILLFFLGSKNYAEYVRDDVRNHPANAQGWTGLSEIARLSDTFKINMWPAFETYSRYWNDWVTSYSAANSNEKQIIDRLNAQYKGVDFVANQYACGSYLYNSETNEYTYTNDILPAFEIPPHNPYTFDFENMIVSTNENFNFTSIKFPNKTKLGGKLELDPNNNKKLIYTPNNAKSNEIDEFDISIIPGNWNNKPTNYVDEYKFKIKVRQEINSAVLETYPVLSTKNANQAFEELNSKEPNYKIATKFNTVLFEDTQIRGIKIKYKFVAPKDGYYKFENKYDDYIKVFVNGEQVYNENHDTPKFKQTYAKQMKKGEVLNFENQIINTGGAGGFDLNIKYNTVENSPETDQVLDKMVNILSSYVNFDNNTNKYLELLTDPKYKYKPRQINREIFNRSLTAACNLSTYSIMPDIIEPENYEINAKNKENNKVVKAEILNEFNDDIVEIWSQDKPASLEVNLIFKQKKHLASFYLAGRTNNWTNARPTKIKITGYDDNEQTLNPTILYEGDYGTQFNDRLSTVSKLNLSNPKTVKSVKVEMDNELMVNGPKSALSIKWIRFSSAKFLSLSNSFGFNNPLMNLTQGWSFRKNDELNSSALNNLYVNSIDINNKISFTLNNCSGFEIIGQWSDKNDTVFDIYVNGKLFNVHKKKNNKVVYNDSLFHYVANNPQKFKIEIVSKTKDPLYLNYVMTFGDSTYLS